MTPQAFLSTIIAPAVSLFPTHDSAEAQCCLLAFSGVESGWRERRQVPGGQARGFWQCEEHGAVEAVLTSPHTRPQMETACATLCIPDDVATVFEAIAWNDPLAYFLARLNLLLDEPPLPAIGDSAGSYATYIRVWAPGAPSPQRWASVYPQAAALFAVPTV